MTRKLTQLTLAQARKFANPASVLSYLPEPLEDQIQSMGFTGYVTLPDGCTRLTETHLFSFCFGSDEVAMAVIYSIDGEEFLLAEKYGDKTDWETEVLSHAGYSNFVKFIVDLSIERYLGLPQQLEDPEDHLLGMSQNNSYIVFTETDSDFGVHILSPKWSNFQWLFRSHDAYYGGERVEFVRWVDDRPSWQIPANEAEVILRFPDGTERAVEGIEVAFILKENPISV